MKEILKEQNFMQDAQQQDPLSLYEELSLISPGWADTLFKEVFEDHSRLCKTDYCIVGEAYKFSERYVWDCTDVYCKDCTNYSQSIYVASNSSIKSKVDGTYNRDKFHSEISKFVNHFKKEHGKK